MTTLGARGCPSLEGVPGPAAPALPALPGPIRPCPANDCGPPAREPDEGCWFCCSDPRWAAAPSVAGWLLLRASVSCVCDEEGVAWAEPEGEFEAPSDGEAVPEFESFFLDDFPSLLRERTLCRKPFMIVQERSRPGQALRRCLRRRGPKLRRASGRVSRGVAIQERQWGAGRGAQAGEMTTGQACKSGRHGGRGDA